MRRGTTVFEMVIVITVASIIGAILIPPVRGLLDRAAVRRAANEVAAFYHGARLSAVLRGVTVVVDLTPDALVASVDRVPPEVLRQLPGPSRLGVDLEVSRARLSIRATGLGYGAANTKLVFRRGAAADSITISIFGRLRRYR